MVKNLFILLILSAAVCLNIKPACSADISITKQNFNSCLNFFLDGDVLYKINADGRERLFDKVAAISEDKDTFYYMRCSGEKWIAGIIKQNPYKVREFDIPGKYEKLYKYAGSNDVFYFLARPARDDAGDKQDAGPVFTRFNPDQSTLQSMAGVEDFVLLDGRSVILKNGILDFNGLQIPLVMQGKLEITGIIDSRMVIISGADGTEIADIIAGKSIYQYSGKSVPDYSDEYNLVLEFSDVPGKSDMPAESDNSIYYEIFVNGMEESRTETGRGALSKTVHSKLVPGKYNIIKTERWELDKVKGRYNRLNNVYQPAELKVYIPDNRILKIKIEFNGTAYNVKQSVLFK